MRRVNKDFSQLGQRILQARENLEKAQQLVQQDRNNVWYIMFGKLCVAQLLQLRTKEEQILQQRAKVDWITLVDGNNAYFHAILKESILLLV